MSNQHQGGRIDPRSLSRVAARRPRDGAVFEMHAHSSDRSLDSGVRAEILAEQARIRGLDGFCLTDHNAMWSWRELVELSERAEVTVLGGMELGTDVGHVLVYGLDRYHPELLVIERLRQIVRYEGAAMVLAHPMRPFHGRSPRTDEIPEWFDGLEVINGDHSDTEDGYLVRHAAALGLAAVAGSDAHSRDAVGRAGTAFPGPIHDINDIAEAILHRRVTPLDFRPRHTNPGK